MNTSSRISNSERPRNLFVRLLGWKSFRLAVLVSIAVFELVFIYIIKHFGWLESIDMGTQVLVVLVALLPLIIAVLVMAGKRFKLSSVFIAFALFAAFMTFSLRPVWDARNARLPAKRLTEMGVILVPSYSPMDLESEVPVRKIIGSNSTLPDWIVRILGEEWASLPTQDDLVAVRISGDLQFREVLKFGQRLDRLSYVHLYENVTERAVAENAEALLALPCESLAIGTYNILTNVELGWLEENQHLKSLALLNVADAPQQLIDNYIPGLEIVLMSNYSTAKMNDVDWGVFFDCQTVAQLKGLQIHYGKIDNADAQEIGTLENLKYLSISNTQITDFSFLEKMPNLRTLEIVSEKLTVDDLQFLRIPKTLRYLLVSIPRRKPNESADWFEQQAPEGCEVKLYLR